MEEEEARLKLLLDQTSDYDERKKIRADLRTLRQKKLDVLNTAAAAESSERAARRAERARARKAEQSNGDASTAEKESSGVVISEQILAEIDDEETLQKLLNEIPTSQFEDRRRIRARIRAVKRKKAEGDQPSSRSTYSRKTKEVTVTSDEPSEVTVQTTIETSEVVTNHYGGDEETSFKLSLQQSKDVEIEESTEDISEQPDEASVEKVNEVPTEEDREAPTEGNDEAIEEQQNEIVDERVSDMEQKDEEPEFIEPEAEQDDETMRDDNEEISEPQPPSAVDDTDDIPTSFEEEKVKETESEPVVNEEEMKDVNEEETKEGNEQLDEGTLTFKTDDEICVQVKIDEPIMVNIEKKDEEAKTESKASTMDREEINEAVDDNTKSTQEKDSADGPKPALKDDVKPASKSAKGSRWPPAPADEKAKKSKRINATDFRGNLKKSGKIGTGVVNLENRKSTTGAQVDFRGGLKQTGKSPINVKLPSRSTRDLKGKADFSVAVQKHEGTGQENGDQKDAGSKTTTAPKEIPSKPAAKEEEEDLAPEEPPPPVQAKDKKEDLPQVQLKAKKEEPPPVQPKTKKDNLPPVQPKAKKVDSPPVQPKVKKDDSPPVKLNAKKDDLPPVEQEVVIGNGDASPAPKVAEKEPKVATKDKASSKVNKNFKLFQNLSNTRTDTQDKQAPPAAAVRGKVASPFIKSQKKAETPTDKAVNGVTLQVKNTSLATKESTPAVKIEVTEHVEDEGDTKTEVKEVNTTKEDDEKVEEKKEVTKVSKTSGPGGGQVTTETKETTTKTTTKKSFVDPELQKRMAARQRERFVAKKEQASSAKNKRMAFMQKLEANSPTQKAPSNIKRSGSNVDKLLAWCRFKTRDYEGIKLSNFSSSWGDGLAFCALLHLYLPDKIPYEELRLGNDKRRNFEVAFGAATEAGVPELLEVDDMLSVANPEPKSVMTYVSSIYKHFNPS